MSQHEPKISIGIPVYNGGDLLSGLLNSLINQEYSNLEFIICDNGSTDDTEEIYRNLALRDSRFRIYRFDTTIRADRNFIRVFELAGSNPFFMWAAHDDRFHPAFIRRCYEKLKENPTASLAYTWTRFIDNDGKKIMDVHDSFDVTSDSPSERYLNLIGKLGYCNAFYGLYRKSYLDKIQLDRKMCLGWDALCLTEILLYGKWIQIPEALFYRNMHRKFCTVEDRYKDSRKWIENVLSEVGEGITMPHLEYIRGYLDVIKNSEIDFPEKPKMVRATVRAMIDGSFFNLLKPEIERAIYLVCHQKFYEQWNPRTIAIPDDKEWISWVRPLYLMKLLKDFEDVLFLCPHIPGVHTARAVCLLCLNRFEEAKTSLELEMKKNSNFGPARMIYSKLIDQDKSRNPL